MLINELIDKVHKKPMYFLSAIVPLDTCSVEELGETNKEIPTPRGEDPENVFLIHQKGQNEPFIIICESQREKVKWMADILVQIEANSEPSQS